MLVQTFTGPHGYEIRDVAITTDNARFASCGGDTAFYLWDVATARVVKKFSGHAHMINSVAFNAEGTVVLSGSYDRTGSAWIPYPCQPPPKNKFYNRIRPQTRRVQLMSG